MRITYLHVVLAFPAARVPHAILHSRQNKHAMAGLRSTLHLEDGIFKIPCPTLYFGTFTDCGANDSEVAVLRRGIAGACCREGAIHWKLCEGISRRAFSSSEKLDWNGLAKEGCWKNWLLSLKDWSYCKTPGVLDIRFCWCWPSNEEPRWPSETKYPMRSYSVCCKGGSKGR